MGFTLNKNGTCQIEGMEFPAVGFGTYPLKDQICLKAVTEAANLGYRIIDTATYYQNLGAIGEALKTWERTHFYLISKVWPDSHTQSLLHADLEKTLEELETSYLDAYLLHWPNHKIPIEESLEVMEALRQKGLIRHVGLSNVTVNHLKRALECKIPIAWIQIEMNPFFYEPKLLEFCKTHGIMVQAWAPLGRGLIRRDPLLQKIGDKYGKTASQVALKWILSHGCIPLPASQNHEHMRQNLDIFDFNLKKEEIETINLRANSGKRQRIVDEDGLGFADEFDFSYEECWPKKSSKGNA